MTKKMTTKFFWNSTLPTVNSALKGSGFAVMPTANGVMCLVAEEDENLNCPPLLARFRCSQLASVSTVLTFAKLAMGKIKAHL